MCIMICLTLPMDLIGLSNELLAAKALRGQAEIIMIVAALNTFIGLITLPVYWPRFKANWDHFWDLTDNGFAPAP